VARTADVRVECGSRVRAGAAVAFSLNSATLPPAGAWSVPVCVPVYWRYGARG